MAAQSNITVRQLYRMLALTSTLRFPRYPCYYFPAFLLIELYRKCRHRGYRLLPAPKKFIDTLTRNELLKSDHYCIISEAVYDTLVPAKDLNWINVIFSDAKDGSERGPSSARNGEISKDNIVQTILNKPNSSILLPAISFPNCPSHCVFVSENCYENFCTKYKLNDDRQLCPIHVRLKPIGRDQTLPRMASRATIFLLRNAYDLSFDATDEILHQYFRQPRILYRNHTYDIPLDELVLDSQLRAKYLSTFNDLRRIYFRCLHLESADNPFEIMAVVVKGTTTLHQTTSINYPIPRQCLDDYCCLPQLPWGLQLAFDELKTSLLPFIDDMYPSAVQKQATNATNEPSATVNKSKMLPHRIHPLFLIQGDAGTGRKQLVNAVARSLGLQQYKIRCSEIVSTVAAQTEAKLKAALARADTCEPLLVSLELFDVFGVDHEGRGDPRLLALFQNEIGQLFARQRRYPLIIIAMTSKKTINPLLQRQFLDVIRIAAPNEQQRYAHFHWLFNREIILQEIFNRKSIENVPLFNGGRMEAANACLARHFSPAKNVQLFHTIAEKTKGFVYGDIKLLFDNCIKKMMLNNRWMADGFDLIEIERCLTGMQKEFSASLGAPKVPKVLWSDIGGLAKLKDEIQSSIGLPLKHMHLMGKNMRRSGILLYGPPGKCCTLQQFSAAHCEISAQINREFNLIVGTGKTLVAKAVATECNLSFLSVQGPELLNMYVGQSEQNVREGK